MVESIANIVRAWPADRARNGQPYLALELICGAIEAAAGRREMEWSINIRCEPETVTALDGAISAAYPDVRLGRIHGEQPLPRPGVLREPGYVMRFRKERSFVYSLIADGEREASSPLEQIARAQVVAGRAIARALPANPDPIVLRGTRPTPLPPPRKQARAPGALGTARGRPVVDVQPRRDARRRANPEPQPVLARNSRRRRQCGGLQGGRRRGAVTSGREPPSPPVDGHPPGAFTAAASRVRSARSSHHSAASSRRPRSRTCSRCPPRA